LGISATLAVTIDPVIGHHGSEPLASVTDEHPRRVAGVLQRRARPPSELRIDLDRRDVAAGADDLAQ
jgi:hypothetical protein